MNAIEFENISKQYKLGYVSTKTLSHDLNRWWTVHVRHKEDPYLKIGSVNDRSKKADSDYVWALKDINFNVEQGDVVGIIGKNGAGKSTLLKLLSRVTAPTTGEIRARGRIASLLEVGTGFHTELTGRENVYMNGSIMGMTKKEITAKLDEIVDFAGVERYIDTPVKRYSSGMLVRLGFAVAAHLDPEILVVDEVLAVGDAEFQKKAIGKMQDVSKGEGRTVLFVSHNMASIKALCKHGVLLKDGQMIEYGVIDHIVDLYMKGDTPSAANGNLLDKFVCNTNEISVSSVFVNGYDTDTVELRFPNRELGIEVSGFYSGSANLDMEVYFYDDRDVLVGKHSQSLTSGNSVKVNNDRFSIKSQITLLPELTDGQYYVRIDIIIPRIAVLASSGKALNLLLSEHFTESGIPIDRKHFGYLTI